MEFKSIEIKKPEAINFILGQTHFIKTVEDLHEALVTAVPGIKFGLAFCEASGKCLVRWSGTDEPMMELARQNALAIGAGHCFIIFLGDGFFPVNVLIPSRHALRYAIFTAPRLIPPASLWRMWVKDGRYWVWLMVKNRMVWRGRRILPGAGTCYVGLVIKNRIQLINY